MHVRKPQLKSTGRLLVAAAKAWSDDYAPSMGAAISYYTVFSLAPLLVIVIAIAGAVLGREAVQGQIVAQLGGLVGRQGAELVQSLIAASSNTDKGLVAGLISGVVLLVGATSVFAELQNALDRIWHVPPSQKPKGIWSILRARVLSFGLILGLVFLLMVSLAVSAAIAAIGSYTSRLMPGTEFLLQAANFGVSTAVMTVLFAMIYKLLPNTKIAWHDVWVGAFVTALLFEIGKFLIGLYLGKSSMTETFAAAGSMVILIAWVYYAAQIFLLGAEFTKVYAQAHGSHAATQAMQKTQQTAVQGAPAEGSKTVDAPAVPVAAAQALPDDGTPQPQEPRLPAEIRLESTRERLRNAELPPPVPKWEKAMAGGAAVAGAVAVTLMRRMLQQRRRRDTAPAR